MKMKKMLIGAFLGMFAVAGIAVLPNYAHADRQWTHSDGKDFAGEYGGWDSQDTQYNAGVAGSAELQEDNLINTIRTAINWLLGILSLIALCLCLWGGFQMMTSGGDSKKYENGLNVLKWAAIGLAIIGCSWLIVSVVFYIVNASIGDATTEKTNQQSGYSDTSNQNGNGNGGGAS